MIRDRPAVSKRTSGEGQLILTKGDRVMMVEPYAERSGDVECGKARRACDRGSAGLGSGAIERYGREASAQARPHYVEARDHHEHVEASAPAA